MLLLTEDPQPCSWQLCNLSSVNIVLYVVTHAQIFVLFSHQPLSAQLCNPTPVRNNCAYLDHGCANHLKPSKCRHQSSCVADSSHGSQDVSLQSFFHLWSDSQHDRTVVKLVWIFQALSCNRSCLQYASQLVRDHTYGGVPVAERLLAHLGCWSCLVTTLIQLHLALHHKRFYMQVSVYVFIRKSVRKTLSWVQTF